MADPLGLEPRLLTLEDSVLPITLQIYNILMVRPRGFDPLSLDFQSSVITISTKVAYQDTFNVSIYQFDVLFLLLVS